MKLEYSAVKSAARKLKFRTQAFIDGKFVNAQSGKTFTTENPATGKPLAQIAACDAPDVDRAVKAARRAFESGVWSRLKPADRKKVLLEVRRPAGSQRRRTGAARHAWKPASPSATARRWTSPTPSTASAGTPRPSTSSTDHVSPTGPENLALILREPVGVVGCVMPWNFPAQMAAWKIGPALAAGNSVVLKPAELTSLSAIRMAELAAEAGRAGRRVQRRARPRRDRRAGHRPPHGRGHGRLHRLDRGGPLLPASTPPSRTSSASSSSAAARARRSCSPTRRTSTSWRSNAVSAAFWNMGENCSCGSRLIVHKKIKDELVAKIAKLAKTWKVGDPLDPQNRLGAMIEKPHLEKVLGYIEAGKAEGAKLVMGGKRILEKTGGYFVEVTIFDEVTNRMKIAREEIFGPVLSVIPFSTEEEAVAIANDTNYGLAASLYTRDLNRAHRVARAIRAGTVSVNCFSEGDITTPFGGFKESGFAGRDKSIWAHEQYTELKTIWMQLA